MGLGVLSDSKQSKSSEVLLVGFYFTPNQSEMRKLCRLLVLTNAAGEAGYIGLLAHAQEMSFNNFVG
jgi:hypothetical protein